MVFLSFVGVALTGCGASISSRSPIASVRTRQESVDNSPVLRADGYTVAARLTARGADGSLLYVYRAVCSGSADGHCQAVYAFVGGRSRPVWRHQYVNIRSVRLVAGGFAVTSDRFRPSDPLCCPSLSPQTRTYVWTGGRIRLVRSPVL